jgi:hypothetical protein
MPESPMPAPPTTYLEFEKLVLSRLDEAERRIPYPFTGARRLIAEMGAVKAAKILLDPTAGKIHDGLKALIHYELIHLSIEQAVIDFADRDCFTEDDISTAKVRLYYANKRASNDG